MKEVIPLILETDPFFDKSMNVSLNGFVFKFNNKTYTISIHHNLPIKSVYYDNSLLNIKINSNWSEILILDSPSISSDLKIHKIYQNKLPNINDVLCINNIKLVIDSYDFMPFDNLPNSPKTLYIKAKIVGENNLIGLSGYPVYYNNILIGIMSKWNIKTSMVYIIPFYVVIKNLLKNDNNNIYIINKSIKLKKIGYFNVKDNDTVYQRSPTVYQRSLKIYIPIDFYFLLEGDEEINNKFICDNNDVLEWSVIKESIIHDINIKNINNIYKVTNRLLSLLNKLNIDKKILMQILNRYIKNPDEIFHINKELMII